MAGNIAICVGTIGAGLWRSPDSGNTWYRATGIWGDSRVFAVTAHPNDSNIVFAGTDEGVFKSVNKGESFEHLESPMDSPLR